MTPYRAALFMRKRGVVSEEFIQAYLEEEARRAGCDVEDLLPMAPFLRVKKHIDQVWNQVRRNLIGPLEDEAFPQGKQSDYVKAN